MVQNVNGISNQNKCGVIEKILLDDNTDVVLQLDTRLSVQKQEQRKRLRMWNPKFAGLRNDGKRGRGIQLNINPASPAESVREIYDPKGNYLISEMIFCDNPLLLVGVYAPNEDKDEWWEELYEKIDALNYRDVIIVGDFNQIMDPELDCKNYVSDVRTYKPKCRSLLKSWLDSDHNLR